jgi:uncharacterized membrane protein YvbJ
MVYCTKCGTKNPDDAKTCSNCGASLYGVGEGRSQTYEPYRRMERECFGIPRGGTIVFAAIGLIIVLAGIIGVLQAADLLSTNISVWPFVLIIFGVLIVIGALYGMSRRR